MTLAAGDLTTPSRVALWLPSAASSAPLVSMLITSCSQMIYARLNRARLFSQQFVRTFDGVGNYQLVLPDWPVTKVTQVQMGSLIVQPYPLPSPMTGVVPNNTFGFGYRVVLWEGNLPGQPSVIEFDGGFFWRGVQNIQVTYQAGYLISNEAQVAAPSVTVLQPLGIWCRDNGVTYAATGMPLTPIASGTPAAGQYIPPVDTAPGVYTFSAADAGQNVLISYSFIPADLEEACIQLVAERYVYRSRVGEISKSLGGQETMRFWRPGGKQVDAAWGMPPEVMALIQPYVAVTPPLVGAPV